MLIRAQFAMVINLDKCLGCHACAINGKKVWTNREGQEYAWWANVETRPGVGYPKLWEDQERYGGGWVLVNGKLRLRLEVEKKFKPLEMRDYYTPYTYDYKALFAPEVGEEQPVANPINMYTKKPMEIKWSPNWDDDLGGANIYGKADPNWKNIQASIYMTLRNIFMFYLPRLCNHCLNPACVAACPTKAIYKRKEDGIVLIDQTRCKGYRYCEIACPYKKIFFNWKTGKSEKCIFCYPRLEVGLPPICVETCVGRIRYVGVVLYDEDKVLEAASAPEDKLVAAHRSIILDPFDPKVIKQAKADGVPDNFIKAAQESPAYYMFKKWEIALPLHPEYRTLPMVFYIPPLSPVIASMGPNGTYDAKYESIIPSIDEMRIPLQYLANMFAAGNVDEVKKALKRLVAIREFFRRINVEGMSKMAAASVLQEVGLSIEDADLIYKWLALGKDRWVIPTRNRPPRLASQRIPSIQSS